MTTLKLESYEDWKHCITEICKVPLSPDFVARRLQELRNPNDYTTQRFIDCWGRAHLDQVVVWFEQAQVELNDSQPL